MKTVLFISQVYIPDSASVGQHFADAAQEMAHRGWRTVVLTADSGYEDPGIKFPRRAVIGGVEIQRFRWSSMGKKSLAYRMAGQISFVVQSLWKGLFMGKVECLVITTIPQLSALIALPLCFLRRIPLIYWVMDLNPDQAVALGHFQAHSPWVRLYDWLNRLLLRRARAVIALDKFMAERLTIKYPSGPRLFTLPPWPHEEELVIVPHEENPFIRKHQLSGKFVFMYSGNFSLAHPLVTFLKAIEALQENSRLMFVFIGGGMRKGEVDSFAARLKGKNFLSLPYQDLREIKYSLSAADVHMVSMGNEMVGCVHPCKIYGAMAMAKPILYLGPPGSHIADLLQEHQIGWHVNHGQVEAMVETILSIAVTPNLELKRMGGRAQQVVRTTLSKSKLCDQFCDIIEQAIPS